MIFHAEKMNDLFARFISKISV